MLQGVCALFGDDRDKKKKKTCALLCCRHCAMIEVYTARVPGVGDMKEGMVTSTWEVRQGFTVTWGQSSVGKVVPKIHLYMI